MARPQRDRTGRGPTPSPSLEYAGGGATLTEVVEALEEQGYRSQVVVNEGGRLTCRQCGATRDAGDFSVDGTARTEGASDPADMSIVVALRCPSCGAAGALAVRYGPEASPDEADVLARLPDRAAG